MPNFCPTSGLPLAGKAAERNSRHNRGIGLTTNAKGCCSLQNPILRLSLHLVVILLALTICCSPILQVNRESGQSCPKNQLGPERPAETWEQVIIGHEERAFFCPTKNLYLLQKFCTNSVVLQEQSHGTERAEKHGQAFRRRRGEVSRKSSVGMGFW